MKILYLLYQIVVSPLLLLYTILTALTTTVGCTLGKASFWGYWPAKIWSHLMCITLLLPVRVKRNPNVSPDKSYVFVSNHEGAFDIFLIYGYLNHSFKWMMKQSIRHIPLVGRACEAAGHLFINRGQVDSTAKTLDEARRKLRNGASLVVFPEGTRTPNGSLQRFKRGAFMLADGLQLPVVPITIDGSYEVMNRKAWHVSWHRLTMTIHDPIVPQGQGSENQQYLCNESRRVIAGE